MVSTRNGTKVTWGRGGNNKLNTIQNTMRNTIPILDLIYPRRCPVCQNIVVSEEENGWICTNCKKELPYVQEPGCLKCGKEIDKEEREFCGDCIRITKHYKKGYPVFSYRDPVKSGVTAFKYRNRREYVEFYSQAIWERYGEEFRTIGFDGILPVPMYRRKQCKRGYNQAELLANRLGEYLEISVYSDILVRITDTIPQKVLNDRERINNLKKAFHIQRNDVKLEKILLVDDIYTTGATIEACTDVLLTAGVKEVYYTSICIGTGAVGG